MAKDAKNTKTTTEKDPVATAPDTTRAEKQRGVTDSVVSATSEAAQFVRRVLPNRVPTYLGGAALLVLGVVDLPVAAGGALAYEAARRWDPAPGR